MHGFPWVRIDRTLDRTAGLKKVGRQSGKDEVYALGLLVRLKLTIAGRFPDGIARLSLEDLALEMDVPNEAVAALLEHGYLEQVAEGLAFIGWNDDPAIRDLVTRRNRSTGSRTDEGRQEDGQKTAEGRQPAVMKTDKRRQEDGTKTAVQYMTKQDMTGQDKTGQDMETMPKAREARDGGQVATMHAEVAHLILQKWPAEKRCHPRNVVMAIRADQLQPDASTCSRIASSAAAWVAAYDEQGRTQYLPRLDNWISSGAWREQPPQQIRQGSDTLTEADWDQLLDAAATIDASLKANERIG